jgi:hypothetical protein
MEEFEKAWECARNLLKEKKWNALNVYVLDRFGEPIIEVFVEESDWEILKRYNQQMYNNFKVVFSSIRSWNPAYE